MREPSRSLRKGNQNSKVDREVLEAAVQSAKNQGAERIIIAVPTSSMSAYRRLSSKADTIICPDISRLPIFAVANAYQNWYDLDEKEVLHLLENLEKRKMWQKV